MQETNSPGQEPSPMSVPYSGRVFHDEPISDSNHSADALDDNWGDDGQEADVSISHDHILILVLSSIYLLFKDCKKLSLFFLQCAVVRFHPNAA